jgi:hypothetical protein
MLHAADVTHDKQVGAKRMHRLLALAIVVLCATPALSDPLPQPRIDFEASSKGPGGTTFFYRHHEGKLRIDVKLPGTQVAATSLVDISGRKVVAIVGPASGSMAVELDLNEAEFGLPPGLLDAKRIGAARVAGEPCNLWEVTRPPLRATTRAPLPSATIACITPDGIPLRTETVTNNVRQVVMEAITVTRAAQDPSLFAVPPGTKIMKAPAAMQELLGAFSGSHAPKP